MIKSKLLLFTLLISGISMAQIKKDRAELVKEYEVTRFTYDSLCREHAVLSGNFNDLLNKYRAEQSTLTRSFESAFSIKNKALSEYDQLVQMNRKPQDVSRQQLDTVRLYKLNDTPVPNWSAIRQIQRPDSIYPVDWSKVPKKKQADSLSVVIEKLSATNGAIIKNCAVIRTQSTEINTLTAELGRLSRINSDRETTLKPIEANLNKQLPYRDELGGINVFSGREISPPPPPPVMDDKNAVYTFVDEIAEFPGGASAMKEYLAKNIVYPKSALEAGIEGTSYVQFIVSTKGNISNVEVKRGVPDCPECDKEAVRVIKAMPAWKPAKKDGKEVNSTYNLPVKFRLTKPEVPK